VTISHTPGLRIRFVRFRQTVWGVKHMVTIVGQYNCGCGARSTPPARRSGATEGRV